jgi:hypothetical protein
MDQFTVELATSILHLEMQKEKILKEDELEHTLCICRRRILYNYINVCQLFFIRFTGKIIKFMEDEDVIKTMTIDDLHEWYEQEMYDKLFHKKCMSNKMILLYKLLNKSSDEAFFKYFFSAFQKMLDVYLNRSRIEFKTTMDEIYSAILEWMESHILGIISLQLECDHISDQLLVDFASTISGKINIACGDDICTECFYHNPTCPKRSEEAKGNEVIEKIHLYITEDQIADLGWVENYIRLITKYHMKTKNIELVLDFILLEDERVEFTNRMFSYLNRASGCFKSVTLLNTTNVDFSHYKDQVQRYLVDTFNWPPDELKD